MAPIDTECKKKMPAHSFAIAIDMRNRTDSESLGEEPGQTYIPTLLLKLPLGQCRQYNKKE